MHAKFLHADAICLKQQSCNSVDNNMQMKIAKFLHQKKLHNLAWIARFASKKLTNAKMLHQKIARVFELKCKFLESKICMQILTQIYCTFLSCTCVFKICVKNCICNCICKVQMQILRSKLACASDANCKC